MVVSYASILVVGADSGSMRRLRKQLRAAGHAVFLAPPDATVPTVVEHLRPDLILLGLPGLEADGVACCRRWRAATPVPIVVVAGAPYDDVATVLDTGADECLSTAMPLAELLARVRAKLRRVPQQPSADRPDVIALGALRIDLGRHSVFVRGREVPLRAKEFTLLTLLARHAGHTVPHATLLRHVWGPEHPDDAAGRRTLMVHVRWLREKLEDDPGQPRLLVTEPAVGYRLVPGPAPTGDGWPPSYDGRS